MAATPGVPTAAQREGRIEPPPMPYGELELQPPPPLFAGEGAMSNVLMTAVPMIGSVGSVAFVAMTGKSVQSYLAAGRVPARLVGVRRGQHLAGPLRQDRPGDEQPPRVPQLPQRYSRSRPPRRLRAAQAPHVDPPRAGRARRRRRGGHAGLGARAERRRLAPRPVCPWPATPRAGAQAAGVRHHRQARPGVGVGPAPAAGDAPDPARPADRRRAELVLPHRDHRCRGPRPGPGASPARPGGDVPRARPAGHRRPHRARGAPALGLGQVAPARAEPSRGRRRRTAPTGVHRPRRAGVAAAGRPQRAPTVRPGPHRDLAARRRGPRQRHHPGRSLGHHRGRRPRHDGHRHPRAVGRAERRQPGPAAPRGLRQPP